MFRTLNHQQIWETHTQADFLQLKLFFVFLKCLIKSHSVDVLAFTHTFPLFSCLLQSLFIVAVCEAALRWVVWKTICALTLKKSSLRHCKSVTFCQGWQRKGPFPAAHTLAQAKTKQILCDLWLRSLSSLEKKREQKQETDLKRDDQKSWHNLEFKDAGTTRRQQEVRRHPFAIKGS